MRSESSKYLLNSQPLDQTQYELNITNQTEYLEYSLHHCYYTYLIQNVAIVSICLNKFEKHKISDNFRKLLMCIKNFVSINIIIVYVYVRKNLHILVVSSL